MSDINELFYQLIRVAIGTQASLSRLPSHSTGSGLTPAEWEELFDMAVKQSLVGICFIGLHTLGADSDDGFAKVGMSEELFFDWIGMAAQIQMKNEQVNEQCVELQKRLADEGLRSCVLKGQGVATLYGEELRGLRQSGDIDLWVDGGVSAVIKFVSKYETIDKLDNKHLHFHCFQDTEVELHWSPVLWFGSPMNSIVQAYFDGERERQFACKSDALCVPTSDFQVVHQLLHVYNHYVYEGVGLRQMMDLYFALRASYENQNENEDFSKVVELFKRLGLIRFVAATQWVLQEVFGMPESVLLCAPDAKEGRKLLDEIMVGGNFGHHDERNHVAGESFVQRFLRRWGRKFRMFRFDPLGTLLMPLSRLRLELWMRRMRRKYNV